MSEEDHLGSKIKKRVLIHKKLLQFSDSTGVK